MLVNTLVSLVPLLAGLVNAVPVQQLDERANVCVLTTNENNGGGSGPITIIKVITTDVVQYPVLINTYIAQNTVLRYNGGKLQPHLLNIAYSHNILGVEINIYNAPTQVITVATGSRTATNTAVTTV